MDMDARIKEFVSESDDLNDDGSGDGSGEGFGSGYGSGSGDSIKSFCGHPVYIIDGIQTVIYQIHRNVLRGAILNDDLTTEPCYIIKQNDCFARGFTLREAFKVIQETL